MRPIRYIILAVILVTFIGSYPRELQVNAPSVFAVFAVILVMFCNSVLKRIL
jgi:hypothetical protein